MTNEGSLKELLCLLADSGIPFVVVGGYAARMHGTSLLTEDIDICAFLSPETIARFRQVLAPYHPVHRMTPNKLPFDKFTEDVSHINNLYIKTDLGQLDLLGSIGGVGDFQRVYDGAVEVSLFGRKCRVISIDDLIAAKKFVHRPHDLETVKQLEWIKERVSRK